MKVLIADDDRITRIELRALLRKWGHEVVEATDGMEAWEILTAEDPPRLAVLDWLMPRKDGVTLCRDLMTREKGPLIYTILLTVKNEIEDLVHGLEAGAHDFITKPVEPPELKSRIEVGLRLIEYDNKVFQYTTQMEQLAEERAKMLVHSDRLATLGTLSAGLVHEINNPTAFISANIQMIQKFWDIVSPKLGDYLKEKGNTEPKMQTALEMMPETIKSVRSGIDRINGIVKNMRGFARRERSGLYNCDVITSIENSLQLCHNSLKYKFTVQKDFQEGIPETLADGQRLEQVFVNLIVNACDAMEATNTGDITIRVKMVGGNIRIVFEDSGPGIPEEMKEKIWETFFTTKDNEKGTGLGLPICKGIIEEFGGRLWAENRPEGGASFIIELASIKS